MSNNFRFWVPLDSLKKSTDEKGKVRMRVGGLASTNTKDMDGESLEPSGFDISYLKSKGIINWNHNKSPNAVIGEPVSAKITKAGLYVEADLYPDNVLAQQVYSLAETLEKNSTTRRLGFSIEGKATERNEADETHVTKAIVTNIALTISPKNPDSIVDIIKGNYSELDEEELTPYDLFNADAELGFIKSIESKEIAKACSAGSESGTDLTNVPNTGASLKKESIEGVKSTEEDDEEEKKKKAKNTKDTTFLTKSEIMETILKSSSVISIDKANKIFETLNLITMATEKTSVSDELLQKALTTLGINKGVGAEDEDDGEEEETAPKKKFISKKKRAAPDDDEEDEGSEDDDDEEDEDAEMLKSGSKPVTDFQKIKKSIDFMASEHIEMFRGVGTLLKGLYDEVQELKANNDTVLEQNVRLQKSVDDFGDIPNVGRKAISKPLQKSFEKGFGDEGENLEKGGNGMSVSGNRGQVLNLLDTMTFEKGFDQEMSKAMTTFESSGVIGNNIIQRVRNEKGIQLVK